MSAYATATGSTPAARLPGVEVLLELRQAVQADYFARRLAARDLTGIDGPEGNLEGLHHARSYFSGPLESTSRPIHAETAPSVAVMGPPER